MNIWIKLQIERVGLFKVVALIWVMTLTSVFIIWVLVQPEETASVVAVLGVSIVGLVGTIIAWIAKGGENLTQRMKAFLDK